MRSATTSRSPADSARRPRRARRQAFAERAGVGHARVGGLGTLSRLRRRASARNQSSAVERGDREQPCAWRPSGRIEPAPLLERRLEGLAREVLGDGPVLWSGTADTRRRRRGAPRPPQRTTELSLSSGRGASIVTACTTSRTPPCLASRHVAGASAKSTSQRSSSRTSSSRAARWRRGRPMFVQSSASVRSSSAILASTPAISALEELELGRRRFSLASGRAAGFARIGLRLVRDEARRFALAFHVRPAAVVATAAARVLERDDPARRQRRAARGRGRRAGSSPGTPRAPPRAPRGSPRSRWFVGSSSTRKFAPDATSNASASRRRSPPESAVTGVSCVSQPEKRKRAEERSAPVAAAKPVAATVASSTDPLVGARASCCEKYAGIDAVPEADPTVRERMPVEQRLRAASSCPSRSARRGRRARRARSPTSRRRASRLSPAESSTSSTSSTIRPLRGGSRKSKPSERRFFVSDSISLRASARSCLEPRRSASASPAPASPSSSCSGTARRSARAARCLGLTRARRPSRRAAARARLLAAPHVPRPGK